SASRRRPGAVQVPVARLAPRRSHVCRPCRHRGGDDHDLRPARLDRSRRRADEPAVAEGVVTMAVDAVTVEVVSAALAAVPRGMAANLRRAASPSIVREARDFAVAIVDADGDLAFQPEDTIPMMTLGISSAFRGLSDAVDMSDLTSDDAFLVNDPFRGGQHLQD